MAERKPPEKLTRLWRVNNTEISDVPVEAGKPIRETFGRLGALCFYTESTAAFI